MTTQPRHLSAGYQSISPYIFIRNAAAAMDFYKRALGAVELMRWADADGTVRHGELQVGDSILMISDEHPEMPSAQTLGGSPIHLHYYVADVDTVAAQAVAAGMQEIMPVTDQHEDRRGGFLDPYGLTWWIATRIQDVTRQEIEQRLNASEVGT